MSLIYDPSHEPLYRPPLYESADGPILPPKQAAFLTEPMKEKHFLITPCAPKPYRIMTGVRHISAFFHNNAAVDKDGVLWRWGAESIAKDAKTGVISEDLSQDVNYIPKRQMENVESVCAGPWHMMCITKDGSLWGWGQNEYGQLGVGDRQPRTEPTLIMKDVIFVYTEESVSVAIKKDKTLWGWGTSELLFPDSPNHSDIPVHLMNHVIQANVSDFTALVVKENHTLWGWGSGFMGDHMFWKPTMLMENVKAVSIAQRDTCFCMVVTLNGDLYSLGISALGSIVKYYERKTDGPIKVFEHVEDVKVGARLTFIRTKDNRLFASGDNILGQCGTGKTSGDIYKPVFVMDHVSEAVPGYFHGMALRENGDVWIWGGDYCTPTKPRKHKTA